MAKRNSIRDGIIGCAILGGFLYFCVAMCVFAWRHPWLTSTEQLIYFGRAMTWGTVDYEEARPRHAKPQ